MTDEIGARANSRPRLIRLPFKEQRWRVAVPLRRGIFLVPATITSLSLLAGVYSVISAINGHFELAAIMVIVSFVCDGLDGRVARASRTSSQFGVEYDSLADVVAFGVAPAILAYTWALRPLGAWGVVVAGLFVVCAALRLARFNVQVASVDKRRFVGLPVPGAAGMIAGVVLAYSYFELSSPVALCVAMAPLTLALGGLMISRVPYPSFKVLSLRRRAPIELMLLVLIAAAFVFAMPQFALFVFASAYVLSGPALLAMGEEMTQRVPFFGPAGEPDREPHGEGQPNGRAAGEVLSRSGRGARR